MHKLTSISSILTISVIAFSIGCRSDIAEVSVDHRPPLLRIAAASDLQPWLGPALEAWGKSRQPPIRVETIYGSSHQLAAQIRAGAPVDLFLSADEDAVRSLVDQRMIEPASVRPYAIGKLAILCRKTLAVSQLQDLKAASFRHLVIASPESAPYGKAAKAALISSRIWPDIESQVVITSSVRQAFQSVVDGNAEIGIVSLGHAQEVVADNPEFMANEIPTELHPPILQFLGIVSPMANIHEHPISQRLAALTELRDWLVGPSSDTLFRSHALARPIKGPPVRAKENRSQKEVH